MTNNEKVQKIDIEKFKALEEKLLKDIDAMIEEINHTVELIENAQN